MAKDVIRTFLSYGLAICAIAAASIPAMTLAQDSSYAGAQEDPDATPQQNDEEPAQQEPAQQDADTEPRQTPEASAQDNADLATIPVAPQDDQAVAENSVRLEEIVVTSEKRAASIQDVPLSVTAITGENLERQGIAGFQELQSLVPGLQLEIYDPVAPRAILRGITYDPNSNTDPTVDLYFNEVNINGPAAFQSIFDLERVEVLRGAQTTLRAGTAPGGAIVLAARKPSLSAWEGSSAATFSTNNAANYQLAGGGPLIDGILGVRLALLSDTNGLNGITNIIGDRDEEAKTRAWRVVVAARPFESQSVGVTLTHQQIRSQLSPYFALQSIPGSTREPHIDAYDRKARTNLPSSLIVDHPLTALAIDWDDAFAGHTLNYVGGYWSYDQYTFRDIDMGNAWPAANSWQSIIVHFPEPIWTNEIRLSSPQDQAWRYRVGALHGTGVATADIIAHFNTTTSSDPSVPPQDEWDAYLHVPIESDGYSYFAETAFDLGDQWSFELGARQGHTEVYEQVYLTAKGHPAFDQILNNFEVIPPDLETVKTNPLTGHLVGTYRVTKDFNAYSRFAHSYRRGSINIEAIAVSPNLPREYLKYGDEKADSLELGIKSDWMDGRLRFNASVFQQIFDGYVFKSAYVPVDTDDDGATDGGASLGVNADVNLIGAEWELAYLWGEHLQLSLAFAHSKGRFEDATIPCDKRDANGDTEFTDENGNSGVPVPLCKSSGPIGPVPKYSTVLTGEYTWPLPIFDLFLRGAYKYDGERLQTGNYGGGGESTLPGYGLANLFFGAHNAAQTWEVSVWAKNLFDEEALIAGGIGELVAVSDGTAATLVPGPVAPPAGGAQVFESGYSLAIPVREREIGLSVRYAW